MLRTALRLVIRVGLVVGVAASFGTGCSRQAEGERCDFTWAGDQDCDDGLVCTPCGNLQQKSIDRCCKPGGSYTDTRCIPTTNPTGEACNTHNASSGGTGGTTGEAGTGATSEVGGSGGTSGTGGTTSAGGTGGTGGSSGTGGESGTGAASGSGGAPDGG